MAENTVTKLTTSEWLNLRDEYVAKGVGNGNRHIAAQADGALITDIDGQQFIDFAGAIGVQNVGRSRTICPRTCREHLIH